MSRTQKAVQPDTQRMVEGFRDTGYTFNAAIADIIDNSIAAGADEVGIDVFLREDEEPEVWVSDNGSGMDVAGLENAMRYGSRRREDVHSLGRFGLGLKTASTSFCKRLTVVTRAQSQDVISATWDLDTIAEHDDWILDLGSATDDEIAIFEEALGEDAPHGTVVVWQKVDRLLKTKAGRDAKNKTLIMKRLNNDLETHLALVFQRFLDPSDNRARTVTMTLNSDPVAAWDPFREGHGGVEEAHQSWGFESPDGVVGEVLMRAFILPRPEEFENSEDRQSARITNKNQGIYLYREDRLIEGPSWLGLGAADTHTNNLRVELSFPAPLDDIFGVGIRKSGVHVDQALMDELEQELKFVRKEANRRARKGNVAKVQDANRPSPTENTIERNLDSLDRAKLIEDGASLTLQNNQGNIELKDKDGKVLDFVRIRLDEQSSDLNVVRKDSLEDGVLWLPAFTNNRVQVQLNAGHDWYRKAYLPNSDNSPLVQAIDYLLYALAQAEMNNTSAENDEVFEDFRYEVSKNLRKLVRDLPESEDS